MKSFRKELWFETSRRRELITLSSVMQCLKESGVQEGLLLVNAIHNLERFINDDESGLHHDFEVWLRSSRKPYSQYKHNGFEDNAMPI